MGTRRERPCCTGVRSWPPIKARIRAGNLNREQKAHALKTKSASKAFGAGILRVLGPGLVTGAADDDPSGIATYSQAGAQFAKQGPDAIKRIKSDTYVGMAFSNLVGLAIMVTTAATLQAAGITNIQTSSQAAQALKPVAGEFAFVVFSLGIIGTGLLAIPALAGSAAYALGETWRWPVGLARNPMRAKGFYGTILIATMLGCGICFSPLDPIKALFWSAVINGLVAVPVMIMMMLMTSNKKIMGKFIITGSLRIVGWIATAVMAAAAAAMAITSLF